MTLDEAEPGRSGMMAGGSQSGFLPSVQGLRGLAASTVVVVHLYAMPYLAGLIPAGFPIRLHDALVTGGRGVELFFIISGYLIPASLVRHRGVWRFFYDRAMRIMPLFVILHLLLFGIGPIVGYKFFPSLDGSHYIAVFLTNLFFVPELFGHPIGQQNAWTLAYEWAFYIWFAALFVALKRPSLVASLILVALGCLAVAVFPSVAFFGVGMAMAWRPWRLPLQAAPGLAFGLLCLAAMYYACEYITPYLGLVPGALIFAMVLSPRSGLTGLLTTRPLLLIGKVSYSLYLIHPFVLFPLMAVAKRAYSQGFDPWLILAGFAVAGALASLAAAIVAHDVVEQRLRRRLHRWFTGARQEAAVAPAAE